MEGGLQKKKRWRSGRTCAHLLGELQNCNSLLNNHWQENVGSHQKKRYPTSKGKREAQQDSRRGEITFRIKTPYSPEMLGGLKQNLVHTRTQGPHRDWARPAFGCLSVSTMAQSAVACAGTGALAAADLRGLLLGEVAFSPTIGPQSRQPTNHRTITPKKFSHGYESSRTHNVFPNLAKGLRTPREYDLGGQWDLITEPPQDWGNSLWRAQTKPCVHQDPGERSSDPTRDWHRLACEHPGVSGRGSSLLQGQGHWIQQCWHKPFWRRSPLPHHSLSSGQTTGRKHSSTHQEKIRLKVYWAWPRPSEQTQIPLQPVPPIRELPQASCPYLSEGRQNENHSHRKVAKLIT